jgi:hypothetical protein
MAAASVLPNPSVLPQTDRLSDVAPVPLVRQINELRWWAAVLYLEEHPDEDSCTASNPHNEWSWRLQRTTEKGIYLQNTYCEDRLSVSTVMNTNINGRDEFIAHFFPYAKK